MSLQHTISPVSIAETSNPVILSRSKPSQATTATTSNAIYKSLAKNVAEYHVLQDYLLADLKFIRRKQDQLLSHGIATMEVSLTNFSFPKIIGDNSLKRRRSFLESPLAKIKNTRTPNMGDVNCVLCHSKLQ